MAVTQAQLNQLYLAYFGRPADFDGMQFYLAQPSATVQSVAAAFSASPESQALYGTFGAAQINAIYQNLFNRDAEPAGLAYWSQEVLSGRLSPAMAAYGILVGAQNDDKVAVQHKLIISEAFTAALDTSVEITGYANPAAALSARGFLHTVDASAASVVSAQLNLTIAVSAAVHAADVVPSYHLSANTVAVDEGGTVIFEVSTTNVAAGTQLSYTLSGMTAADVVGGSLVGLATVGSDGKAYVQVTLANDLTTEGAETLGITVAGLKGAVAVNDTSVAPPPVLTLTTHVDVLVGGSGDDAFVANSGGLLEGGSTLNAGDSIDGGAGVNTLIIQDQATPFLGSTVEYNNITVKNIQNVNIIASDFLENHADEQAADFSDWTGLNNLNINSADGAFLIAAATTDVVVADGGDNWVGVDGGRNVTVTTKGDVDVGTAGAFNDGETHGAAGNVSVTTLNGDVWVGDAQGTVSVQNAHGDVQVDGGTNVTVKTGNSDNWNWPQQVSVVNATGDVSITDTEAGHAAISVDQGANVSITATGLQSWNWWGEGWSNSSVRVGPDVTGTINVSTTGSADISIDGGTAVNVNAVGQQFDDITIGATKAATGAVTVSVASASSEGAGTVTVNGGSVVTVNESVATGDLTAEQIDGAISVQLGDVVINGNAATTQVAVSQSAPVQAVARVVAATEKATVTSAAGLAAGASITLGGLTFTAGATALTQAQLDVVFSALADGATTGNAAAYGTYTGKLSGWTTGPADTSHIVTFTSTTASKNVTDLAATGSGAASLVVATTTQGATAVAPVVGVSDGFVAITDENSANTDGTQANTIQTVSLDGYGGAVISSNALKNLTLSNSSATATVIDNTVAPTNTTLNVSVSHLAAGAVLADATIKTLNVHVSAASAVALDAAALTTLTVDGAATLNLSGSAMSKLTSVSSTNTAGVTIALGAKTAASFGDGADVVTVAADAEKNVSTGAGNDTVIVSGALKGAAIDGGTGTDTLKGAVSSLTAVDTTAAAGAGGTITGFEVLEVTDSLGGALNVGKISTGIHTVSLDAATAAGASITFAAGANTLNLTKAAGAAFTVAAAGTGTADSVTIVNVAAGTGTPKASVDVFAGQAITGTGVETLVLDGSGNGTATLQTVGAIGLTATATAAASVKFVGSNSFQVASIVANAVDASGLTGAAALSATVDALSTTGSANADHITLVAAPKAAVVDDPLTVPDETKAVEVATVSGGAGDDHITVQTSGAGNILIDAGTGNDTVSIVTRSTGTLTVLLGDGNDTFTSAVDVNASDVIDAGAGTDLLQLSLVGSANIGAFSNFDAFDAAGLGKSLDVDILASKNVVTEFIASGNVGTAAQLLNVGAGVGFRATGDMGSADALTITQKVAGALTVTLDADETAPADLGADAATASVHATNATSLTAVFDTSYLPKIVGETTVGDNVSTLNLSGVASTLAVVSGGALSTNVLNYSGAAAAVTVTGAQHLSLDATGTAFKSVDASGLTGGLAFSLVDLADHGSVKLGSGADVITVTNASSAAGIESIVGLEKTAAVAVSVLAADADAKVAAIADADVLVLSGATAASAVTTAQGTVLNGVLSFSGAGPATLDQAIHFADQAAETAGEAVVFDYLGNSYVFVQGDTVGSVAADTVVELAGVTGVTNLVGAGSDMFFVV